MIPALMLLAIGAAPAGHDALWKMFDDEWNWSMAAYPEQATEYGDERYDDRLTDWSPQAIAARKAHERAMLAAAKGFDRASLAADDQLNLDLFVYELQLEVDGYRFPAELLQLNQLDSPPSQIAELARDLKRVHVKDYENFLARMRLVPAYVDQMIALLREGLAKGITPPRVTLKEVPTLLGNHAAPDPEKNPLYQIVFADMPGIAPADQTRLRAEAKQLLAEKVIPAYAKLRDFAENEYVPAARTTLALTALPDGKAWYRYQIRAQTTTDMSPEAVHALGLAEVARIEKLMDAVRKESGFAGDRQAFFKFLKTDPRFFYTTADELVTGYRDIAKRIDPTLPQHFGTLPRLTYGVLPMPAYQAPTSPAAYYEPGTPEAGRPGYFMANTYDLAARPKWAMEDLTLHEAVPGHHLQIARAEELGQLPRFRRYAGYTAFVEGWALYCEGLCQELGLCKDVYSRFGVLSAEMWRAVRLVVDTGIHAKGWSREKAIRYFSEHTGQTDLNARVEVDRYIVWPGQALAYKLGQLTIRKLRTRAESSLGEKFDERAFHDEVLGAGALPLPILEARVDGWIEAQRSAARAAAN
ncbi:MAG TPA: DUF885 domain-containing protein [Myxococcales bacterium]|nr:DUF885 domain-containing protein [Myxococcales bacterium]